MWLTISIIIVIIFLIFVAQRKNTSGRQIIDLPKKDITLSRRPQDDFELWVSILEKEKRNIKHFQLFGTKAALLWNDDDNEIEVVCLNRFNGGRPEKGSKYDHFGFDLKGWYWTIYTPHGAAEKIKDEIQRLFGKRKPPIDDTFERLKEDILKYDTPQHFKEIVLFDSRALIWYFPKKQQIRLLSPQHFTKGIASKTYASFYYEIQKDGHLVGDSPKGCKEQIVAKIEEFYQQVNKGATNGEIKV